jgi:hypothetical protein
MSRRSIQYSGDESSPDEDHLWFKNPAGLYDPGPERYDVWSWQLGDWMIESKGVTESEAEYKASLYDRAIVLPAGSSKPKKNPAGLTRKGERMYEHVRASYPSDPRAKEIASRTVRARASGGARGLVKNPLPHNVEVVETVDGTWMVLVDGIQHGGKRDRSGAGNMTFSSKREAEIYAELISRPPGGRKGWPYLSNPHGRDPVITLEDLIEHLELWNDNTDGGQGGEDVYVVVYDDDPDPEKNEWTIHQFFSKRELADHKRKYGGKYAKLRIPGHDKPFNAHRAAVDAFEQMGLRIMNPRGAR